jgi:hypothetical protein
MIDDETFQQGVECDDKEYYARVHGLRDWIGERAFIERLSHDLVRTKRPDRKKALVVKHWGMLRQMSPQAPPIEDPCSWTLQTLRDWQLRFTRLWRAERSEVSSENRKRGHSRIRAEKST